MKGVLLQIYQDKSGRLYFRSDLPDGVSLEEKRQLAAAVHKSIKSYPSLSTAKAACACIRQIALGATMCIEDFESAKREFHSEINLIQKSWDTI